MQKKGDGYTVVTIGQAATLAEKMSSPFNETFHFGWDLLSEESIDSIIERAQEMLRKLVRICHASAHELLDSMAKLPSTLNESVMACLGDLRKLLRLDYPDSSLEEFYCK